MNFATGTCPGGTCSGGGRHLSYLHNITTGLHSVIIETKAITRYLWPIPTHELIPGTCRKVCEELDVNLTSNYTIYYASFIIILRCCRKHSVSWTSTSEPVSAQCDKSLSKNYSKM